MGPACLGGDLLSVGTSRAGKGRGDTVRGGLTCVGEVSGEGDPWTSLEPVWFGTP